MIRLLTRRHPFVQIPWTDKFEHEAARELFGSNLMALTWIKGEPMPRGLVDEILRGLGLERESGPQRSERQLGALLSLSGRSSGLASGSASAVPE